MLREYANTGELLQYINDTIETDGIVSSEVFKEFIKLADKTDPNFFGAAVNILSHVSNYNVLRKLLFVVQDPLARSNVLRVSCF